MAGTIMQCRCCQRWRVEQVRVQRDLSHPPVTWLRVTYCHTLVAQCTSVAGAAGVLEAAGVALADLRPVDR